MPKKVKRLSGSGVKLIWTVDWEKVESFYKDYEPKSEMLFVEVSWSKNRGFYYIPLEVQKAIFKEIGKEKYIYLHKRGTNPRGVEISNVALKNLIEAPKTRRIDILWLKPDVGKEIIYKPYQRWVDLWAEE